MKKIIIDYPVLTEFKTYKKFKDDDERTEWLVSTLSKKKIHSPCHDYTDYVVELVEKIDNQTEYWVIGS